MRVYTVVVGVAHSRPPTIQEYRKIKVAADNRTEASLVATQIAACTCEMPVSTSIEEN